MCRYAMKPYKTSTICVACRYVAQDGERCPFCRGDLIDAGRDFQAPRKRDDAGWIAVETVLRSGKNYDSCGCGGPGYRPRTKAQVRQDSMQRRWKPRGRKSRI
jgi:hypothetical protein